MILLFNKSINAQDPYYINYSINEGLPSSNIYSVYQENNGLLWFTSDVGIVKYDSKKFQLYNTDNGISDNEVFKLYKDYKGRLWLQTLNGNASYIYKNKIYNDKNSDFLKKVKGTGMTINIFQDKKNKNIYITNFQREVTIIDSNDQVKKIKTKQFSLSGVTKSNDDILCISSGEVFYLNSGKNISLPDDKINYNFRVLNLNSITYLAKKNLLYQLNDSSLKLVLTLDKEIEITNMISEGNKWWVCTKKGLFLVENGIVKNHFFKEFAISDLLKDFQGNYWITTLNKGVIFLNSFESIQLLKEEKISCISKKNENEIWFGGYNNNYYIKKNNSIIKNSLKTSFNRIEKISNIRFYKSKSYVIGKFATKIIDKYNEITYNINGNDIFVDEKNIYFSSNSVFKFNQNFISNLSSSDILKHIILGKRSNVIIKGKNEVIYIGTNNGLYYNQNDSFINLGDKNQDFQTTIEDLFFDSVSKKLYVATSSKGLIVYDGEKVIGKLNIQNGLNNNTTLCIKKIGKDTFLLGSNNGLNLIICHQEKYHSFNINSFIGLKDKRIKDIEIANDTIYLATENGLIYLNKKNIINKKSIPKCLINGIQSPNGFVTDNKIDYKNNDIIISFTGISYTDKGDLVYYYKLNTDKKWYSTKETQINFKSLPADKYSFYVYCMNGNGEKSEVQIIQFEIFPPFWQKWWFIVLVTSFVIILFYSIIKRQFNKQEHRLEQEKFVIQTQRDKANLEKQIIELEQKALRMQMNPHFIFNALNTIKGYYTEGSYLQASNYISKFSKLLRNLLENEDQITTLDNEIEMLKLYIELTQIRYEGKFDYKINISEDLSPDEILIPNLLLQPLVENAIIHGLSPKTSKGELILYFSKENNDLLCIVDDNGIGRKASLKNQIEKEHTSKAMNIIQDRIYLYDNNSKLEIIDKFKGDESDGTKVIIRLPLKSKW